MQHTQHSYARKGHEKQQPQHQSARGPSVPAGLYYLPLGSTSKGEAHGVVVQYKVTLGCFTLPGASRTPIGWPVFDDEVQSAVELAEDYAGEAGRLVSAEPFREQSRRDKFWSDVARLRIEGKPFSHMFGTVTRPSVPEDERIVRLVFRSGAALDCVVMEIIRRVDRIPRPKTPKPVAVVPAPSEATEPAETA